MGIGSFLKEKLKNVGKGEGFGVTAVRQPPEYQYGERMTSDKKVIALRRLRNAQMDLVERRRLESSIRRFERQKASSEFMDNSILKVSKGKKRKPSVNSKSCGFLGKGRL